MPTYIKSALSITASKNSTTNTADKGPLSIPISIVTNNKLSVDDVRSSIVTVGTSESTLFDGDLLGTAGTGGTIGGYLYLKNVSTASTTKFINIGIEPDGGTAEDLQNAGDAQRLFTLKTGEFAFFPYDYTMDIVIDATHADQKLEYWLFDKGA